MVVLAHLLRAGLSNSAGSLTLIMDDNRFAGIGKVFWLNIAKNCSHAKFLIISDPRLSQFMQGEEFLSILPRKSFDFSVFDDPRVLFLDSLEIILWVFEEKQVLEALEKRCNKGLGTVLVCNKSYCNEKVLEKFLSLAEIIVNVLDFANNSGTVKCVHLRGYVKNTEEISSFVKEGETIKEVKLAQAAQKGPNSTFRLGMSEEEKKMKDLTPLPYEKFHPIQNFDPGEFDSPDEEGDDDDFFD